jgi:hypothetical protein
MALMLFCAVDLPFSLLGDVVTWPYTCSYTFINRPVALPPLTFTPPPPAQGTYTPPATLPVPSPYSPGTPQMPTPVPPGMPPVQIPIAPVAPAMLPVQIPIAPVPPVPAVSEPKPAP